MPYLLFALFCLTALLLASGCAYIGYRELKRYRKIAQSAILAANEFMTVIQMLDELNDFDQHPTVSASIEDLVRWFGNDIDAHYRRGMASIRKLKNNPVDANTIDYILALPYITYATAGEED